VSAAEGAVSAAPTRSTPPRNTQTRSGPPRNAPTRSAPTGSAAPGSALPKGTPTKAGRRSWRLTAGLLAAGLAGAIAIAGCGSSASDDGAPTSARGDAAGGAQPQNAPPAAGAGNPQEADKAQGNTGGNAPAKAPDKLVPDNRAIIYTGTITVRVSDVDSAANAATTAALGSGGFVGGDNRNSNESRSEARLVLRVPADRFNAILGELGKLGKELKREVSTEDVTEQVVDIESRIATATASVERVQALLARANTISEIVSLESELSRRQADLESLKARQRKLSDLTALSTITVVILGEDAEVSTKEDPPDTGFLVGLKGGWNAFLSSLEILLTILGALLPWFLALGLPVMAVVWLLRRTAATRHAPASQPAVPAATAPDATG
jgi:hypothetical protein